MDRALCIGLAGVLLVSCKGPADGREAAAPAAATTVATPRAASDVAPTALPAGHPVGEVALRSSSSLVKTIRGRDVVYDPSNHPYLSVPAAERRLQNILDFQRRMFVVGGEKADPNEFPWAAAVLDNKGNGVFVPHCGGALIADRWVLTAAHCHVDLGDAVVVGESDLNKDGIEFGAIDDICTPEASGDGTYAMDVALLKLADPKKPSTRFATEEESGAPLPLSGSATAIGWGAKALGSGFELKLRKVKVDLIDEPTCQAVMGPQLQPNLFCAGVYSGGHGICFGDSGGPLMKFDSTANKWIELGVAAKGCAQAKAYDLYTRIANPSVAAWIRNTRQPGRPRCIPKANG